MSVLTPMLPISQRLMEKHLRTQPHGSFRVRWKCMFSISDLKCKLKRCKKSSEKNATPPKFNMEPENKSLEKESPFGNHDFQVPC